MLCAGASEDGNSPSLCWNIICLLAHGRQLPGREINNVTFQHRSTLNKQTAAHNSPRASCAFVPGSSSLPTVTNYAETKHQVGQGALYHGERREMWQVARKPKHPRLHNPAPEARSLGDSTQVLNSSAAQTSPARPQAGDSVLTSRTSRLDQAKQDKRWGCVSVLHQQKGFGGNLQTFLPFIVGSDGLKI